MINTLFLSMVLFFNALHPIYISVTEIEHDGDAKALEMIIRVFIDDLELSIRNDLSKPTMDITAPGPEHTTDQLVKNYLNKHFKVYANGKELDYEYLGHEVELPVMYLYVLASDVEEVRDIAVFNDMLTETYDDQANLVHVKVNDKMKSLKLSKDRKRDSLEF